MAPLRRLKLTEVTTNNDPSMELDTDAYSNTSNITHPSYRGSKRNTCFSNREMSQDTSYNTVKTETNRSFSLDLNKVKAIEQANDNKYTKLPELPYFIKKLPPISHFGTKWRQKTQSNIQLHQILSKNAIEIKDVDIDNFDVVTYVNAKQLF